MFTLLDVRVLPNDTLWPRYSDGAEGEVDLSKFAGRGVFRLWDDVVAFEKVHVGEHGQIAWSDEIEMCPDALYLRLTGKSPKEAFSNLGAMSVDA